MPAELRDDPAKAYELHREKNENQKALLAVPGLAKQLFPCSLLKHQLAINKHVKVLTGASADAAIMLLDHIGLLGKVSILGFECTLAEKRFKLNEMVKAGFDVFYIDDNEQAAIRLASAEIRTFHYTGDDLELEDAINDFYCDKF